MPSPPMITSQGGAASANLSVAENETFVANIVASDADLDTFVQALLSGAIVNISVPPNVAVAPDERIWLEFDQERLHLFDGETEMALKAD